MDLRARSQTARRWAAAAAIALVIPLLPLGSAAGAHRDAPNNACDEDTPPAAFVDRSQIDEVHRRNVDCIAALGVTQGRQTPTGLAYQPETPVDRDQMASFVARSLEAAGHELPAPSDQGFQDIEGNTHEDRINQLAEIGVVEGRSPDRYVPDGSVRRDQMASYLIRAAEWAHETDYAPVATDHFGDVTDANTHVDAIGAAYELWVTSGRSAESYAPAAVVEREAMGSFLSRFVDLIHPENYQTSNQTYIVAPQEAVAMDAGEPMELSVGARYDGEPFTGPVDIVLFPCGNFDPTNSPVTFADLDGNGLADDFASTANRQVYISQVNGQPTGGPELHVRNVGPDADGVLEFTVVAPSFDCANIVVYTPRVNDGLRLDAGDRPAGPFGVGQVTWQ